jgi:predicted GH43/DUF377 family glycosyl hydrolase
LEDKSGKKHQNMKWKKKGLIYMPTGKHGWDRTHAYVVCADILIDGKIRIYYSARDEKGRCHASYLDLSKEEPFKVEYIHPEPILEIGKLGMFDDCGVTPTWLLNHPNGEKWLYYVGWNVRKTIPYHNAIGLATSTDGIQFNKKFEGPILNSIATEPQFNGSASIIFDKGIFKIYYLNCTEWYQSPDGRLEPCYHIKYAESVDGINWDRKGIIAIDFKNDEEGGISRPSVLVENGNYKMWYSYRAKDGYREKLDRSYRIGYAESLDGINWTRKDDESGIDVSENGWDSEMIEYPMIINHFGKKILFYNGNGFGTSGFGYAIES